MNLRIPTLVLILGSIIGTSAAVELPIPAPKVSPGNPVRPAVEAYRNRWFPAAVDLATPFAEKGDVDALYLLGLARESSQPARLSRGQSMNYFYRKAAEAGHPEARLRGLLVPLASNIDKQREEGRNALEAAAAANDATAQRLLGEAWLRGFVDGKPSSGKAAEWWNKSAASGDAVSHTQLGKLYHGAFGFPEIADRKFAMEHYRKAIEAGDDEAVMPLGDLLLEKDSPLYNEEEGRGWLRKAIEKGYLQAYLVLSAHESEVKKNPAGALVYLKEGAEAGDLRCMHELAEGLLGESGREHEGVQWLRKAAEAGNPESAADLGARLCKDSPAAGIQFLLQAAKGGVSRAQYQIGMLYLDGGMGYKDPFSAVAWLTEAMKSGDAETQYRLATLHEQGIGCQINYANAGVLYTMASGKGHAAAAGRIAFMASEGLGTRLDPVQAYAHAAYAVEHGDESTRPLFDKLGSALTPAQKKSAAEIVIKQTKGASAAGAVKDAPASTAGAANGIDQTPASAQSPAK